MPRITCKTPDRALPRKPGKASRNGRRKPLGRRPPAPRVGFGGLAIGTAFERSKRGASIAKLLQTEKYLRNAKKSNGKLRRKNGGETNRAVLRRAKGARRENPVDDVPARRTRTLV